MAVNKKIVSTLAVALAVAFLLVTYYRSVLLQQGLSGLVKAHRSQRNNHKPRYIFVDLGANRADSLEAFLREENAKFHYDFPCPEWATYEQAEIYLFEANPHFNTALVEARERYDAKGIKVNIFPSTVVDIVDGTRTLFLDTVNANHDFWGSSTYSNHPDAVRSGGNGTELTAINLSRWLLMNTLPRDFVVVKMDIEGAEYDILPHMAAMSAWTVIDHLLVEWHGSLPDSAAIERAKAAAEKLQVEGVKMPHYNSHA